MIMPLGLVLFLRGATSSFLQRRTATTSLLSLSSHPLYSFPPPLVLVFLGALRLKHSHEDTFPRCTQDAPLQFCRSDFCFFFIQKQKKPWRCGFRPIQEFSPFQSRRARCAITLVFLPAPPFNESGSRSAVNGCAEVVFSLCAVCSHSL